MADEQTTTPEAAAAAEQGSPITVNAQYTKDLSFEVPSAPQVFSEMQKNQPDININIEVNARPLGEKTFEVELSIKASCTVGEMTGFILELLYAGVFTLNVPDEHRQAILLIECPRLLFPYARNILSDATRDGGFPPVMLGQVDFVAMYQNQLKTAQANADANGGNATA
jgi:preprotein translocase subunit SecB